MPKNPTIEPSAQKEAVNPTIEIPDEQEALKSRRLKELEKLRDRLTFKLGFINKHRESFVNALLLSYKDVKEKVMANENLNVTERINENLNVTERIGFAYISANLPMASALLMLGANGTNLKMELQKEGEGGEDLIATKMMYLTIINAAREKEMAVKDEKDEKKKKQLENDKAVLDDAAKAIEAVLYLP